MKATLDTTTVGALPLPVAIAAARAVGESGFVAIEHLLRAFDRTLRLGAAAVCATYREHLASGGDRLEPVDAALSLLTRPSLGQWLAVACDGARALAARGVDRHDLDALFGRARERLSHIVALRNARVHAEDDSRGPELQRCIETFLASLAAGRAPRLVARDGEHVVPLDGPAYPDLPAGASIELVSAAGALDLAPLIVLAAPRGRPEVFLYQGRHRKRGSPIYLPAAGGGVASSLANEVDGALAGKLGQLVVPATSTYRSSARVIESPYRKLRAFGVDDADLFFGREIAIADVCDAVDASPLVVLHGASGTGKTSLLRAGVRPSLEDAYVWLEVDATSDPLASLRACAERELAMRGADPPGGEVEELIAAVAACASRPALLVVDPLEEIFQRPPHVRDATIEALVRVVRAVEARGSARVLFSLRSDFLADLERLKDAGLDDVLARTVELRALDAGAARAAIVEPMRAAGVTVSPALAERIVRELAGEGGVVSAVELSIVGDALFVRARDAGLATGAPQPLPPALYDSLGGAGEVLARYVRETLAGLEDPRTARRLLLLMLTPEGFRQPAMTSPEIADRLGEGGRDADAVLETLVTERLVQSSTRSGEARFRIAHDLVARELFAQLGEEERSRLEVSEALEAAARAWVKQGRPNRGFPTERQLAYFDLAENVSRDARAFLAGARAAAARRRRIERVFFGVLAATAVGASVAAAMAVRARDEALDQQLAANGSRAGALAEQGGHGNEALALAITTMAESLARNHVSVATSRGVAAALTQPISRPLACHSDTVVAADVSPDGRYVATAGYDGLGCVFEPASGAAPVRLRGHEGRVVAVAFAGGARVLTAGADATVREWTLAGEEVARVQASAPVVALETIDGARVLVRAADGSLRQWTRRPALDPTRVVRWPTARRVVDAHYSPEGAYVATVEDDGHTALWDAATAALLREWEQPVDTSSVGVAPGGAWVMTGSAHGRVSVLGLPLSHAPVGMHDGNIAWVRVSPDGSGVVTAGDDGAARLWRTDTWTSGGLRRHTAPIYDVRFSRDGRAFVTAGHDRAAYAWDSVGRPLGTLMGHGAQVWDAVLAPDDRHVVTTSGDHVARYWTLARPRALLAMSGHVDSIVAIQYAPDARRIVTGSDDGTAKIWDASTGELRSTLREPPRIASDAPSRIVSAAFSPASGDARVLVATDDGRVFLHADEADAAPRVLDHGSAINWATFSPDARHLVTAGRDGNARVWDLGSGASEVLEARGTALTFAAFSPGGDRVVLADENGLSRVLRFATKEVVATLGPHRGAVRSAVFSPKPGDDRVLTSSHDGSACIWDAATGALRTRIQVGRDAIPVWSAVFSPDGTRVAASNNDGEVLLFASADGAPLLALQAQERPVRRIDYSPEGDRVVVGSNDSEARVFPTDPRAMLRLACARARELPEWEGELRAACAREAR